MKDSMKFKNLRRKGYHRERGTGGGQYAGKQACQEGCQQWVLNYSSPWIDSHNGPILIKAIAYLKQSWIQKKQNSSKQFHKTLACCNFFKTRSTFHAYNVNSSLSNVYLQRICPPPSSNSLPPDPCDFFKLLHV